MTGTPRPRVAVVGAGIAGLSCARWLTLAGADVCVLEKSGGPGGRMSTRQREGWCADHGAPFFTTVTPAFAAEVARWKAAGLVVAWPPDAPVRSGPPCWIGTPAMTAPARDVATGLAVQYRCEVGAIDWTPAGWWLAFVGDDAQPAETDRPPARPRLGPFAALVLAIPAAQARRLLATAPALPTAGARAAADALLAAAAAQVRPCWTLLVRHAPAWWPFGDGLPEGLTTDPVLARVLPQAGRPGRAADTWVLQAQGDWSQQHLDEPVERVADAMLAAFARLGAPPPAEWRAHRWRYAQGGTLVSPDQLWYPGLQLGFCSDNLIPRLPRVPPASGGLSPEPGSARTTPDRRAATPAQPPLAPPPLAGVEAAWHSARALLPALCAALKLPDPCGPR